MTTKYFNNTMSEMPTLSVAAGGLNAFLKIMLPMFGWTIEYDSGGVVVYRNDPLALGSSGCYVRIDNTTTSTTIKAFKSMSDIDTGTDGIPLTASCMNLNPNTNGWQIIGDERTVYFNFSHNTTQRIIYGFGDYVSTIPGDEYNYFVSARTPGIPGGADVDGTFIVNDYRDNRSVARNISLIPNTETKYLLRGYSANTTGVISGSIPSLLGQHILKPAVMYSADGVIGILRGCYCLETPKQTAFISDYFVSDVDLPYKGFATTGANPYVNGGVAFSQSDW